MKTLSLETKGAFAQKDLVKKTISFSNGDKEQKAIVYVKNSSYTDFVRDADNQNEKLSSKDINAERIADSIFDEKGNKIFTPEIIKGTSKDSNGELGYSLTVALLSAISEVNSLGKS